MTDSDPTVEQLADRARELAIPGRSNMNKAQLAAAIAKAEKHPAHETAKPGDGKHYALRLTLGGAPATLHLIPGLGYVHGDRPAPVGEPGEPSLERAVEASKDPGCAVELVELSEGEAADARERMRDDVHAANRELARVRRTDAETPQDRIDDEQAALAGQES